MKIISFIAVNPENNKYKFPVEDFYLIDKKNKLFVIADGITRDSSEILPSMGTHLGKEEYSKNYPKPSPARDVAEIFCKSFLKLVREGNSIKEVFEKVNNKIKFYNKRKFKKIDYLMNDFAGCVASGISINKNIFHWGFISDCGVAVFDKNGKLKFRTPDEGTEKIHKGVYKDKRLTRFECPVTRKIIRMEYRNNPKQKYSYGALTGEKSALYYVKTGKQGFSKDDYILIYSDGLEPILFSNKFSNLLKEKKLNKIKELCEENVKSLGSLILIENN